MSNLAENYEKQKEEILERSRKTIRDEGYENAKIRGIDCGIAISAATAAVPLMLFSLFTRQSQVIFAIMAINGAFIAGRFFNIYRFTKNKSDLFFTVCGIITAVCSIATFVLMVLKRL